MPATDARALWDSLFRTAQMMDEARGERFPSSALPCPYGCGLPVCAECARRGRTACHFNALGLCPDGHRLDRPAPEGDNPR